MKKFQKPLRFLLLLFLSFWSIGFVSESSDISIKEYFATNIRASQGSSNDFLLKNSRNGQPLEGYMMHIIDKSKGTLVTSIISNEEGIMKTEELTSGKEYLLRIMPHEDSSSFTELIEEKTFIYDSASTLFVIETYIEREANYIGVPIVMQNSELPNGCEITTLTAVLNYHGLKVSKTTMADDYLPKAAFTNHKGKRIGPDPHRAYAGNPRNEKDGWYVFAGPIVEASKKIIDHKGSRLITENISGSTKEEILSYIDQNVPVIVWVTLDMSPPVTSGGWNIEGTSEFHSSFINLHTVVLDGWENGEVYVMDPLKGRVTYPEDTFFKVYEALGSQAVIVKR